MDYSEELGTIKSGFEIIKKCLDYFESYIEVNYVEREDEFMDIITNSKLIVSNLLDNLDGKIEACNNGYDIFSEAELMEIMKAKTHAARILYQLNMGIFQDILVGYGIIEIYGMPDDEDEVDCSRNKEITDIEKFLAMSLEERMEILGVDDYTTMCRDYSEYVTYEEFEELLRQGQIQSIDNIIEFKGIYYDNESSIEAESFLYGDGLENKKGGNEINTSNSYKEEFPHDYYQEQLSDLEDMEYYGSDMSQEEISEAYNDVMDEYAAALEEYNEERDDY